ncbi:MULTISPECIES: type II secretion system minor pseudopilin GspI [unclassified Variovorax]|mgnify:CR=1 FL=1|jgi:general secretion pathway protein I|uniref:type II secretion system minor pseudopilin GspI n=1 Tax=unclassified Variovorax TaxID=663243 RepID=UPI000F7DEC50|nr:MULTISPECIES: type II secretion system minor pseudopilin GspI [unclassified Variovorax]RSZ45661.1 type II secretion system protein GspI [Variovorax sp. 553]RSZ46884.1 type II secretion system protein GspI [Variovorax sp. 679]
MNEPRLREAGFTLIEVLIALAIVSIALAAIVRASSLTITNLGLLEQQSLAMLSAENRLAELRIGQGAAAPGVVRSACPQGGLRLMCRTEAGIAVDGLRTVTVDVYLAEDGERRLASLRTRVQDGAGK